MGFIIAGNVEKENRKNRGKGDRNRVCPPGYKPYKEQQIISDYSEGDGENPGKKNDGRDKKISHSPAYCHNNGW